VKPLPPTAELGHGGSSTEEDRGDPGVVAVFAAGAPACTVLRLGDGHLEIGREVLADAGADDDAVSRSHVLVAYDGRRWTVRDLGSRNGTFVDCHRIGERVSEQAPLIRLGRTILLGAADVRRFTIARTNATTVGPRLRAAYDEIDGAARFGHVLHLTGESGTGKELAARRFHASGSRAGGPFVAVNCAAIPEGVAERLLFGAVRGAYSGADASADGYVQAADHGTLFLDEIAELDASVQAKLLRVLETREVLPLGASRARSVDFGLCSATHGDLRVEAGEGRFREDLYYRVGRPHVRIPPLRERREEIPFHLERALRERQSAIGIEAALVEACMLRPWPGNIRELTAEAGLAAQRAVAAGRTSATAPDLAPTAGQPLARALDSAHAQPLAPDRAAIESALRAQRGNVTAAARALGMHRNQLRRWLDKEGVDPQSFSRDDGS
jgi:DNA-binding NtrC family response regulator